MYCMFKKLLALSFFSSLALGGNGWETFFLFIHVFLPTKDKVSICT